MKQFGRIRRLSRPLGFGLWTVIALAVIAMRGAFQPRPYTFPKLVYFPEMPQAEDNPVTEEGVALGRHLFYDPILSRDSSISCASCHQQQAAFSNGPKRFSEGIGGQLTSRNAPPLFNLAWNSALFWDGKAASLEQQVFFPVRDHQEMDLQWLEVAQRLKNSKFYLRQFRQAFGDRPIDSVLVAKAIAQFERTLLSHRSKFDRVLQRQGNLSQDEYDGFVLVNDQSMGDCLHCHPTDMHALGTTGLFSNNGLDAISDVEAYTDKGLGAITGNPFDNGRFKIPSLRNLGFTAPYMHDGRFQTLKEVVDFYANGLHNSANVDSKIRTAKEGGNHLTDEENCKIVAFLHALDDSAFVSDPAYSDPFIR